jgi:hypothetical protein
VTEVLEELATLVRRRRLLRRSGANDRELAEVQAEIARLRWRLAGAARKSAAPDGTPAGGVIQRM